MNQCQEEQKKLWLKTIAVDNLDYLADDEARIDQQLASGEIGESQHQELTTAIERRRDHLETLAILQR